MVCYCPGSDTRSGFKTPDLCSAAMVLIRCPSSTSQPPQIWIADFGSCYGAALKCCSCFTSVIGFFIPVQLPPLVTAKARVSGKAVCDRQRLVGIDGLDEAYTEPDCRGTRPLRYLPTE